MCNEVCGSRVLFLSGISENYEIKTDKTTGDRYRGTDQGSGTKGKVRETPSRLLYRAMSTAKKGVPLCERMMKRDQARRGSRQADEQRRRPNDQISKPYFAFACSFMKPSAAPSRRLKAARSIAMISQASSAVTVALRGSPLSKASSPKNEALS